MGKRASEYQRAYQTSPVRALDEEYKSNYEYRRLRRSAEMAHRVIDWPDENGENETDQNRPESKKGADSKKPKADSADKLKSQKTQTSARKLGLEAATQTPEKPVRDVSVNGEVSVSERESRSAAKKRAAKTELARKAERKPRGIASDADAKVKAADSKQNSDEEEVEPGIAKLNLRERDAEDVNDSDDEKPVPKIDILELLKGIRTQPTEADSKRKRPTQQKKHVEEPSGRPASASKQRIGRVQALFEVESNRQNAEVVSTKRPFNLYLYGAGDRSRNGVAVKRTYNVSAPQGAVHETALRAAKRREAERASARRRKRPTRGSARPGQDDSKPSVEQNEFEKWMRRETSQWTTEYRSNFKQHDRTEYARNREMAARCSVLRDDEDLLAIALNPNYDAAKSNGHSKQSANLNPKVKLNFVPSSTRSASARSTSTRSVKSGGSGSSRPVE